MTAYKSDFVLGMIDTILASRGRVFFGTWFSTFTGYIVSIAFWNFYYHFIRWLIITLVNLKNRMRGYNGFPGNTSYYGQLDRKFSMHHWESPDKVLTAREWPTGWVGIDGDIAYDHFIEG